MTNDIIIDPTTDKNIQVFRKSPFPCLALIGPAGSGKTFLAAYICDQILDPTTNKSGASVINIDAKISGIDEVRDLQKSLKLTTYGTQDIRRAVIISNFDYFGHEAQNSLLKTLEEPPLDTIIVITVNNESKVLQTIYSRVKKIVVRPVSKAQATDVFLDKYSDTEINKAFSLSMGQTGLLTSLLEDKGAHDLVRAIELAKNVLKLPKANQLAEIDKITKSKDIAVDVFLDGLLRIFNVSYALAVNKGIDVKVAHARLVAINECIADVELGLNKKLSLTRLFLKI